MTNTESRTATASHTPGPWHAHYPSWHPWENAIAISDDMGLDICWTTTEPDHDAEANARLIAAAPDMLATLQHIDKHDYVTFADFDRVRAVIAKATGAA